MGGPILKVAGGDTSECSLLFVNLPWDALAEGLCNWVDGGGVIAPMSGTGEPSLAPTLTVSLVAVGLENGTASLRCIAWSGSGVRGALSSDMMSGEVFLWLDFWRRSFKQGPCRSSSLLRMHTYLGTDAAWLGRGCTVSGGVVSFVGQKR